MLARRLRPPRSIRLAMSFHKNAPSTSPKDKGKQRAPMTPQRPIQHPGNSPEAPLSHLLEEALNTPLPPVTISSSPDSSFQRPSLISPLPRAHQPPLLRPHHPRLLQSLARSTLPTATLTYAQREGSHRDRASSQLGIPQLGESSTGWSRPIITTSLNDGPFPDLDPSTGLPLDTSRDSANNHPQSRHLQRTITGLLSGPPRSGLTRTGSLRSISTSASQDDWTSWASGWWSGNKGKVDHVLSEEDQADTVEEERDKLREKYRTPKYPLVFCHGLLGFDHLGPSSLPSLQISHWRGIREVLESNGVEVLITRVPATASIKDRAAILANSIAEKYPDREVNLIGHSMVRTASIHPLTSRAASIADT